MGLPEQMNTRMRLEVVLDDETQALTLNSAQLTIGSRRWPISPSCITVEGRANPIP
jgi:hypothetical protein